MTKQEFKNWLNEHRNEIVGYAGSYTGNDPLMNYARSINFAFGVRPLPKWADTCREAFICRSLPGRVYGHQALTTIYEIIGA